MKKATSQWDFGELFNQQELRQVRTVSELTRRIKALIEDRIGNVWVSGEVSNLRRQASGHWYFTLKDSGAQIGCVLFRGERVSHRDQLEDGVKVILNADTTVYEPQGKYQLVVRSVELAGIGALQLAFEKLKRKLDAEGLFDPGAKKSIPQYSRRIGLVTSQTGAAIRDVLHVIERRDPSLRIVLAPCRVQGPEAPGEIANAIRNLNRYAQSVSTRSDQRVDLILITRGGGSLEDLWAFNEEKVARAIFESHFPVISAVGHEIDFTISDFVADLRAATPSAAAELITEGVFSVRPFVADVGSDLALSMRTRLQSEGDTLFQFRKRLKTLHPKRLIEGKAQRLDDLELRLLRAVRTSLNDLKMRDAQLGLRFQHAWPSQRVASLKEELDQTVSRLAERARRKVEMASRSCAAFVETLKLLSPMRVLERGYSITTHAETGEVIRNSADLQCGQVLKTKFHQGAIQSVVSSEE